MNNIVGNIIKRSIHNLNKPINIVCTPCPEHIGLILGNLDITFYMFDDTSNPINWNINPYNIFLIQPNKKPLPITIDIDLGISFNRLNQFNFMQKTCHNMHVPLINIEYMSPKDYNSQYLPRIEDVEYVLYTSIEVSNAWNNQYVDRVLQPNMSNLIDHVKMFSERIYIR